MKTPVMAMWTLYRNANALDAVVAFVGGARPSSVWVHPNIQAVRTRRLFLPSRYLQVRVPLRVLPSKFKQKCKQLELSALALQKHTLTSTLTTSSGLSKLMVPSTTAQRPYDGTRAKSFWPPRVSVTPDSSRTIFPDGRGVALCRCECLSSQKDSSSRW